MVFERVRHALLAEIGALEDLQRRSSMIWEDYRDDLRRHPEAIEVPAGPVLERRVRVAIGDDGCVFGFCTVVPLGDDVGDLAALFVEPQYMGRGVGRKLIDDAVAIARGQGGLFRTPSAGISPPESAQVRGPLAILVTEF